MIKLDSLILVSVVTILYQQPVSAQSNQSPRPPIGCGTLSITPAQARLQVQLGNTALQQKRARGRVATGITYVPIRPHIVRRSDGSRGITLGNLNYVMALANSRFLQNGSGIQFYFAGSTPHYLDDDAIHDGYIGDQPLGTYTVPNALNQVYAYHTDRAGNAGYANYPFNDLISTISVIGAVTRYEITPADFLENMGRNLIPHELGHNFNLVHTHGPINGALTDELVTRGTGRNCDTAGDLLCDTPADPSPILNGVEYAYINNCPVYDPNNTVRDAQGAPYDPPVTNIMGYWHNPNTAYCSRHEFTPGQYERMQAGLAVRQTHTAYTLDAPPTAVVAPANLTAAYKATSVQLNWQDNANNEMGYFIERSTLPTTGFVPIGGVAPDVTTYQDTKIDSRTTYYYRIWPSNTTTGSLSPITSVVTSITGLTTTNITLTSAQLNWNSLGTGVNYDVQWRTVGTPTWNTVTSLTSNTYTLTSLSGNSTYEWQVKASGTDGYSDPVVFSSLCTTPQYLSNTPVRVSASLNWVGNPPQTYNLQWRAQGNANWTTVGSLTTSSYSLTGLTSATAYEWRVQGVCSVTSTSVFTDPQSFTTFSCQPPTSLNSASVRSGSALLAWSMPYAEPGRTYGLRYRPVGPANWTTVNSLTATTYSLSGLANNTAYEWQVRAVCSGTESSAYTSSSTFTTFCLAAVGINSAPTATGAFITWGYAGNPEPGSSYELQYRRVGTTAWITVAGLAGGSSYGSRQLTGLAGNTTYEARMRTVCSASAYAAYTTSTTFTTGCYAPPPNNLQVNTVLSSSAQLRWSLTTDAGTTFQLRYRPTGNPNWTTVSGVTATTYAATGLTNNTPYAWEVRTVCSGTESSSFTPGTAFTTRCAMPNGLLAQALATSVALNWLQAEPGAGYELRYREAGAANWTTIGNLTGLSTAVSGLVSNTNYEWQVRSRCSDGSYSDFSSTATFRTSSCSSPFNLIALTNTSSAQLRWLFNAADAATRYEGRYRPVGATDWTTLSNLSSTGGVGTYDLTGLSMNTAYQWQLKTLCSPAEQSVFVDGPTFTTGCSIPANLFASVQVTSARLNWTQPGFTVNYEVRYRQAGTANWTTLSPVVSTTVSLPGLTGNTGYEWQVRTLCSGNASSAFSGVSSFTTSACLAPFSTSVSNLATNSVRLNWGFYLANADTRYEGRYRAVGAANWILLSNLTSSDGLGTYDLAGLATGTSYEWQIRTICSATESSGFTASSTFQTLSPCLDVLYTVKTGLWTDPTIWSCNRVPASSDVVQIKHPVTIPVNTVVFVKQIRLDPGKKLIYSLNTQVREGF